jgi:hypothetical protein
MGMKVNGTSGLTFPDTTTLASAGQASVRAWVNFNGTGTVAIRAAYNVTSITDNGTGDYTLNFTTALSDADYAVTISAKYPASPGNTGVPSYAINRNTNLTTGAVRINTANSIETLVDMDIVSAAIFR